jgi:hypothetical protein
MLGACRVGPYRGSLWLARVFWTRTGDGRPDVIVGDGRHYVIVRGLADRLLDMLDMLILIGEAAKRMRRPQ